MGLQKEGADDRDRDADLLGRPSLAKTCKVEGISVHVVNELSELIGYQVKMDQLRRQETVIHGMSKAAQKRGLEGTLLAMNLLMVRLAQTRPHSAAAGTASGISVPFGNSRAHVQDLAVFTTEEEAAAVVDDRMCKKNELSEPRRRKMRHRVHPPTLP